MWFFRSECLHARRQVLGAGRQRSRDRIDDAFALLAFRRVDHHLGQFGGARTAIANRRGQFFRRGNADTGADNAIDKPV